MSDDVRRRYYLTEGDSPEREVTKAEFVRAERDAGFINTMREPAEPATASFSGRSGGTEVRGRTEHVSPGEPITPAEAAGILGTTPVTFADWNRRTRRDWPAPVAGDDDPYVNDEAGGMM